MSSTQPGTTGAPALGWQAAGPGGPPDGPGPGGRQRRRRWLIGGVVVALVAGAGAVVAVTGPFSSPSSSNNGVTDNAYPISYTTVEHEPLQSQTEVQGTLTFASTNNSSTTANVVLPAGTATSTVQQAESLVASAHQALSADEVALQSTGASNAESLSQAEEAVSADEASLALANTANYEGLTQVQQSSNSDRAALGATKTANSQSLAQADQAVAQDEAALATTKTANSQSLAQADQQLQVASSTLSTDQAQLLSDEARLSAAQQKEAADCAAGGSAAAGAPSSGTGSSGTGSSGTGSSGTGSTGSVCSSDEAQVAQDQSTVTSDTQAVTTDQAAVQSDRGDIASTKTKNGQATQQAQAQLLTAQQDVTSTRTKDTQSLQQAQAQLAAAQQDVASTNTKNGETTQQAQAQLAAAQADVTSTNTKDQQSAQQAEAQLNAARLTLSQDESALADDRDDAAVGATGGSGGGSGGASPTYTYLPQVGHVVRRGQELFAIDGQESILFYGNVTPWRAFMPGMSPGPDVAALNTNLDALGYGKDLGGDSFTAATEGAVKAFQSADQMPVTGQIALGSVLFEPGTVEVNSVTPTLGSSPSAGQAVLQVTLTARQVQIALDASQQSDVAVGDAVSIVMPDNSTTPGVVSYVGTIATTPSSQNGGSGTPTINVNVTPLDPAATGNLDDLPVNVWITEASVPSAYVVQVDALVALSGGGYALEVAPAHGAHYLEAVSLGLFDDADGLVQVTGAGVQAGQRIVVPQV